MIPNCQGCKDELNMAIRLQDHHGFMLCTMIEDPETYPDNNGHFGYIMINEKGDYLI